MPQSRRDDGGFSPTTQLVTRAPRLLALARSLSRHGVRGAGYVLLLAKMAGALDAIAEYRIGDAVFRVPLSRTAWDEKDVLTYEREFVAAFRQALAPLESVTLLDCGADIGTFSVLLCSGTHSLTRIIALEPSPDALPFLQANLAALSPSVEVIPKAISDFEGSGELERPGYDPSDHARFLARKPGCIPVTTLDHLRIRGGNVAVKLDIEGGELEALHGAKDTICAARACVIGLEASPAVARRTGRDPVECLRFLISLRDFRFLVAETGELVSAGEPILHPQQAAIWNIVAWTHDMDISPPKGTER